MEEIILATNNKGKIKELEEILKEYKLLSLKEAGINIEVEEDKDSFEGNALKKAREICKVADKICIADDSGLCIDSLDGFPGVYTARFLGENATQEERNTYLLEKLGDKKKDERTAKVVTCIALVKPNGEEKTYIGELNGYIAENKRGDNGFGFDEIFELDSGKTLAELDSEDKNKISSRRIALNKLREDIENI